MNNNKLTNILLIILLIFNVAFVGKWWVARCKFHPPKKEVESEATTLLHDRNTGEMFLVKTLGLDTLQQKKLDVILAVHYNFFEKSMGAYIRNQTNFFSALKDSSDSVTAFRCADSMGIIKAAMEKEMYLHFLSIKNICKDGQQKQYDKLIDNMSKEFVHHHDFSNNQNTKHDTLNK